MRNAYLATAFKSGEIGYEEYAGLYEVAQSAEIKSKYQTMMSSGNQAAWLKANASVIVSNGFFVSSPGST